jgi:RNA polymerase sigma-70 factor (ECF subfamily)
METDFREDPGVRAMLAWKAGDEAAFERLVVEYSPQVYALLTRFLGLRPNREDLVQEVFLRVVRARERYEPTARFSTWLFRIVYHLSINETQRAGARERGAGLAEPDERADALGEIGDPREERPEDGLERDDVVRAVRAAIARLPEQQRMALILAKYEEMPYADVAGVLGSSEKAVKSLVHRARETLRTSLAPFLQGLQGEAS